LYVYLYLSAESPSLEVQPASQDHLWPNGQ
jgi:hypothetical protein